MPKIDKTMEGKTTNKQISAYVELSEEEKLKRYRNHIQWAEESTKRARKEAERNVTYYRNKPQIMTRGGQRVVVPTAIKNVDAMFAALTAFAVVPVIAPKGFTTYDMSRVQQAALRNEWDEQEVLETTEFQIKDSLIGGIGFTKVSYELEEIEEGYEEEGDTSEGLATETQTDMVTVKDSVIIEHIPYDEVYWDPEAIKWSDVTWVAQKHILPIEEVKADERFENTDDLGPSAFVSEKWRGALSRGETSLDADEQRVVLWEFHDLVRGNICWFADNHEKILREQMMPMVNRLTYRKRNQYIPYITRKDPKTVWGIADITAMRPAIDEQNVLRSSIATWVERAKPKLLAEEGVIPPQGKKALKSSEYGEVVELREGAVLNQSIRPLDIPNFPSEFYTQDTKAAADADNAIGMTDLLGAQLPVGRKTATAMQQLGQATTVRQSEKRNSLERLYREIADKMLYMMQAFYEQDRITRLVEDMGDVVWDWNNEDISFEVAVAVEMEPKEILDADAKREKFLAMLNILGQDPAVNQAELRKYVLRDGLGIPAEIVRLLVKTQEEMQMEQQAQFQQELALKGSGGEGAGPPPTMEEQAASGSPATAVPVVPQ